MSRHKPRFLDEKDAVDLLRAILGAEQAEVSRERRRRSSLRVLVAELRGPAPKPA